jgi:hypothetical protein
MPLMRRHYCHEAVRRLSQLCNRHRLSCRCGADQGREDPAANRSRSHHRGLPAPAGDDQQDIAAAMPMHCRNLRRDPRLLVGAFKPADLLGVMLGRNVRGYEVAARWQHSQECGHDLRRVVRVTPERGRARLILMAFSSGVLPRQASRDDRRREVACSRPSRLDVTDGVLLASARSSYS